MKTKSRKAWKLSPRHCTVRLYINLPVRERHRLRCRSSRWLPYRSSQFEEFAHSLPMTTNRCAPRSPLGRSRTSVGVRLDVFGSSGGSFHREGLWVHARWGANSREMDGMWVNAPWNKVNMKKRWNVKKTFDLINDNPNDSTILIIEINSLPINIFLTKPCYTA